MSGYAIANPTYAEYLHSLRDRVRTAHPTFYDLSAATTQ